jgi:formylglycine-generating enzyme required for sulfatase activity
MAKIALLIGVSEYQPGLNPLPAAVKDVDAVQEVLLHPDMGGFTESSVTVLKNPDRQQMETAIEMLFSDRFKDDLVLLFFSGHGIKDDTGRLYLATRGTRKSSQGELIRSTAVSAGFVHDSMSRSRSKRQIVILDSCFSGAFADGMSAKDDGTVNIREQLGGEGRAVLTSSSSTQYSFEQTGEELSLYTRFLTEGIKTGEADSDKDESISVEELHEYASRKVREIKPELKPEIYAAREGFSIRLAKVPPGDPRQRYRKEVVRFIRRGEISLVGRGTLDVLRARLGINAVEAKAIEDEVLEPYRREFQEKLRQYEQLFTELLEQHNTVSESDRNDLQVLQQTLGLRNEDTVPIEAQVTAKLKAYTQNLQTYEQSLVKALRQECPLREDEQQQFQQLQQQLGLSDTDVEAITARVTAEVETYRHHLQQYEQAFVTAIRQEFPLNESKCLELQHYRESLGLTEVDVAPIEAKITTEIKTYQQKLQQYEQAFTDATQRKHYPNEAVRQQLQKTWQTLGLNEADVKAIESRIATEIKVHQHNLNQYEQDFAKAVQQQYPLNKIVRQKLNQRREQLNLTVEDATPLETRITAEIEDHLKNLQQYEQVFSELIKYEYPPTEANREELHHLQQILKISDEDVNQVEARVLAQTKEAQKQTAVSQPPKNEDIASTEARAIDQSQEISSPSPPKTQPVSLPIGKRKSVWVGIISIAFLTFVIGLIVNQGKSPKHDGFPIIPTEPKKSTLTPSSPSQQDTVAKSPLLPPVQNIHGWSAQQVQNLQQQTAKALKLDVAFRDSLKDGSQGPLMVVIPGGRFQMGSLDTESGRDVDERQHEVEVAAFAISKYEVTFEEYDRFAEATGREKPADGGWGRGRRPVINVSWDNATAYADWMAKQTGQAYRLPTEAEWEYAARAGTTTPFYFGETISTNQANYNGNSIYGKGREGVYRQKTVEVGQFPPNAWGLYDMHGNVDQWTCSLYDDDYGGGEQRCAEPGTSGPCVVRGGSWLNVPRGVRGAARFGNPPRHRNYTLGFRLARTFSL